MARKPNYRFERNERNRVQAERRAARQLLKDQRRVETEVPGGETPAGEAPAGEALAEEALAEEAPAEEASAEEAPAEEAPAETAGSDEAATASPPEPPRVESTASPVPVQAEPPRPSEASMKAFESMTSAELSTLHQNAQRLAARGTPKQKLAAQEMLPRLEEALRRIGEAKQQASARRKK